MHESAWTDVVDERRAWLSRLPDGFSFHDGVPADDDRYPFTSSHFVSTPLDNGRSTSVTVLTWPDADDPAAVLEGVLPDGFPADAPRTSLRLGGLPAVRVAADPDGGFAVLAVTIAAGGVRCVVAAGPRAHEVDPTGRPGDARRRRRSPRARGGPGRRGDRDLIRPPAARVPSRTWPSQS